MQLIRIKTYPDSKRASISETSPNVLKVCVRESAQENRANRAAIRAVAEFYGIEPRKIKMVAGHHNQNKTLEIRQ